MDGVVFQNLIIMSGILGLIFWQWFIQSKSAAEKEELYAQLDILDRSLQVIGAFLQKIPEMQPQFSINQNPLGQLLEFIQSMREDSGASSGILEDTRLRDDVGRFSDGETNKSTEESGGGS